MAGLLFLLWMNLTSRHREPSAQYLIVNECASVVVLRSARRLILERGQHQQYDAINLGHQNGGQGHISCLDATQVVSEHDASATQKELLNTEAWLMTRHVPQSILACDIRQCQVAKMETVESDTMS